MYDAQAEIYKIIHSIESRIENLKLLKKEQYKEKPSPNKIQKLYFDIVRLSYRILNDLRTLKDIEKSLARPFMFNGNQYDDIEFM